jgi:hypothetical protein
VRCGGRKREVKESKTGWCVRGTVDGMGEESVWVEYKKGREI